MTGVNSDVEMALSRGDCFVLRVKTNLCFAREVEVLSLSQLIVLPFPHDCTRWQKYFVSLYQVSCVVYSIV